MLFYFIAVLKLLVGLYFVFIYRVLSTCNTAAVANLLGWCTQTVPGNTEESRAHGKRETGTRE